MRTDYYQIVDVPLLLSSFTVDPKTNKLSGLVIHTYSYSYAYAKISMKSPPRLVPILYNSKSLMEHISDPLFSNYDIRIAKFSHAYFSNISLCDSRFRGIYIDRNQFNINFYMNIIE